MVVDIILRVLVTEYESSLHKCQSGITYKLRISTHFRHNKFFTTLLWLTSHDFTCLGETTSGKSGRDIDVMNCHENDVLSAGIFGFLNFGNSLLGLDTLCRHNFGHNGAVGASSIMPA